VKHGCILLSVHCDSNDWIKRAEDILKRSGAEDISAAHEASADFGKSDKPGYRARTAIVDQDAVPLVADKPRTEHAVGSNFDV
jgi:hypothetical protein